jgi:hypothetical protein
MSGIILSVSLDSLKNIKFVQWFCVIFAFLFVSLKFLKPIVIDEQSYNSLYRSFSPLEFTPFYYVDAFYRKNNTRNRKVF